MRRGENTKVLHNQLAELSFALSTLQFGLGMTKATASFDGVAFEINDLEPFYLAPRPGLEPVTYGLTVCIM